MDIVLLQSSSWASKQTLAVPESSEQLHNKNCSFYSLVEAQTAKTTPTTSSTHILLRMFNL